MSLLQDLLALKRSVAESANEWEDIRDEHERAHAAQSDEFHSTPSVRDMKDAMVADIDNHPDEYREATTKELAFADEFSVEHDSDDMVHLLDGERHVRVSMPYHVWVELCQETVHKHAVR